MLVGVIPARSVYFLAYSGTKARLTEWNNHRETSLVHVAAASLAGFITCTATNPIWVVKTRLQLSRTAKSTATSGTSGTGSVRTALREAWTCTRDINSSQGAGGFYRGLLASYIGIGETALYFVLYEKMKFYLAERDRSTPGMMFCAAAAAKFTACCIAYPHEVLRTRLREVGSSGSGFRYSGLISCVKQIATHEGLKGFYSGMPVHLMRVVPNSAIMFFTYELIVHKFAPPELEELDTSGNA
eukprot:m.269210 g.269210  ORF g.269210 m.269210 type:complete len:243 (+) comp22820_c6_seq1:2150-2878(+)